MRKAPKGRKKSNLRDCATIKRVRRVESKILELPSMDSRGGCRYAIRFQIPCGTREVRDFHKPQTVPTARPRIDSFQYSVWKTACGAGFVKRRVPLCTNSGHQLVDGVHSLENTYTCKARFSIDVISRRSTTRSFFDSFLSFSGWCGVRGSSGVTVLIARLGRRASKGL